jgi:hypothetical protein
LSGTTLSLFIPAGFEDGLSPEQEDEHVCTIHPSRHARSLRASMRVRNRSGRSLLLGGFVLWAVTACDTDIVLVDVANGDGDRPGIAVHVVVEDSALATRLGWEDGVPGAVIRIRRDRNPEEREYVADGAGRVELPDVASGRFWIWATRRLSEDEQDRAGAEVPLLAGGTQVGIQRGGEAEVALRAQERGSLVISEFSYQFPAQRLLPSGSDYRLHSYIEVRNNADSTVFLDGRILGDGFTYIQDSPAWPCVATEPYRSEPAGIYAQFFQRFPGTGREYPLAPGQVALIAEQAIDHSTLFHPELPDLRHADFQFEWEGRARPPGVAAMEAIWLRPQPHGTMFASLSAVPFIAEPTEIASLPRVQNLQGEWVLFPAERILDVAAIWSRSYLVPMFALCTHSVHSRFDALPGVIAPSQDVDGSPHELSVHRRRIDGTGMLQRTRVSAADFEMAPRSPGIAP